MGVKFCPLSPFSCLTSCSSSCALQDEQRKCGIGVSCFPGPALARLPWSKATAGPALLVLWEIDKFLGSRWWNVKRASVAGGFLVEAADQAYR